MKRGDKPKCCADVWSEVFRKQQKCSRNASVEEGGLPYCKQHAPSSRRKRRRANEERRKRDVEIARLKHVRSELSTRAFNVLAVGGRVNDELTLLIMDCASKLKALEAGENG